MEVRGIQPKARRKQVNPKWPIKKRRLRRKTRGRNEAVAFYMSMALINVIVCTSQTIYGLQ